MYALMYNTVGSVCLTWLFSPSSPSWATWRYSSAPCTPSCTAPRSSSTSPGTIGACRRATCSAWCCLSWSSSSRCSSSCPAWTKEWPAFAGAGRGTARCRRRATHSSPRNRCYCSRNLSTRNGKKKVFMFLMPTMTFFHWHFQTYRVVQLLIDM